MCLVPSRTTAKKIDFRSQRFISRMRCTLISAITVSFHLISKLYLLKNDAFMHLLVCMQGKFPKRNAAPVGHLDLGEFVCFFFLTLFSSSPIFPFQDPFIVCAPKNPSGEDLI